MGQYNHGNMSFAASIGKLGFNQDQQSNRKKQDIEVREKRGI
jgi:hypothetical protein